MATPIGAFLLTYLFAVVFTDEISLNLSYIDRLVTYEQNVNFTELIPGTLYSGTITAAWAIPPAALSGINAQTVAVKVTATAPENSGVFFPIGDLQAKEAVVYLQCEVVSGKCAEGSVLSVDIPVATSAVPEADHETKITMLSEIINSIPSSYSSVQQEAGAVFESLKKVFSQNLTGEESSEGGTGQQLSAAEKIGLGDLNFSIGAIGNSAQSSNGNFLDTLKPEGDSRDPLLFLRENPLISLSALIIVIVITGAYLLNAKD